MLKVNNISKSYGIDTVLDSISFSLSPGERLGLVGVNGSGKTTLMRILMGLEKPDSGGFQFDPPGLQVGYLAQGFDKVTPDSGASLTISGYLKQTAGDLESYERELEVLAEALAFAPDRKELQDRYDRALLGLESAAGLVDRSPVILAALGLDQLPEDTPVAHLSGGQKTRLALAGILIESPQLLLLDEPTNHLDIAMLEWLEEWLVGTFTSRGGQASSQGVLFVSHDRAFLDKSATGILEIDQETHRLKGYAGNYTAYLEQKLAEREKQRQEYSNQQEEIERLKESMRRVQDTASFKRGGKGDSGDKFAKGFFANRTKGTIRRAKNLESRIERLLTDERVEKPRQSWQMKLDFGTVPQSGKDVLVTKGLAVGYGEKILLEDLGIRVRSGARVALLGENGTGKTTLLRTIAGVIPPLAGDVRLGPSIKIGYMTQEQEDLDSELNAFETIRKAASMPETEARAFLHQFLFSGDDVFTPVGKLSYGERARLSLARLVATGCNLLLLDEPINHLDIPSRARFESAMGAYEGTILAVVHDRYFIDGFASEIWEVRGRGIRKVDM